MEQPSYAGKNITILGLGRYEHGSGIAAVKFFIRQNANLVISDLQSEEDLKEQIQRVKDYAAAQHHQGTITWVMGQHREEDILQADLLVPNQAIPVTSPYIKLAQDNAIPIEHEMTIFFAKCPAKIIGITGTRGKSTTTALIAHLLKAYTRKVWLGGNIAKGSPLDFLDEVKADDLVVLELSNFMLEYINLKAMSPHAAVLLNVLPDHLNRYDGDMQAYADVKAVITAYQTADDYLIVNHDNTYTKAIGKSSKANVTWFSRSDELDRGIFLRRNMVIERKSGEESELLDITRIPLRGQHNYDNILAAIACVRQFETDLTTLQNQIGSFASLEGRLQFIDEIKGVTFINDTTSTTPVSAIAALDSLDARSVILIAGGFDKDLPLEEFAQKLAHVKSIVWLPGNGTERILSMLGNTTDQFQAENMQQAVRSAFSLAKSGDVILLSPGFASFGLFQNEFDRGNQFNEAISAIKQTLQNHL